ncbi:MAG: DNA adenine methylase [Fibromonadaceae bacterium]|nr:DNA adenine methylase [Fibromonadaceae bacterium]
MSFNLENRRYIGSKAKLANWIFEILEREAKNAKSFADLFAGTGVISNLAVSKFKKVIINDILYSNNVIYKAFFENSSWKKEKLEELLKRYNTLKSKTIKENYFSKNFGGKFFEHSTAKLIGHIRQDIENIKEKLTEKEYNILLASLIYSIDRLANTVGHFEAYIKKPIEKKHFNLRLINPQSFSKVKIYSKEANELAKEIKSDLVYIDPPYNSRQYSRFYHLYENLVKWDKPKVFGAALKPKLENMSTYCTVKAKASFEDLIKNLNTHYIAVSYNNTYSSKSGSSKNKIELEDIKTILKTKGNIKIFEHSHNFFNAGKTNFNNHKELLFLCEVK